MILRRKPLEAHVITIDRRGPLLAPAGRSPELGGCVSFLAMAKLRNGCYHWLSFWRPSFQTSSCQTKEDVAFWNACGRKRRE